MSEVLLRERLEEQVRKFQEVFDGASVFETMTGDNCLRVCIRPQYLREDLPVLDRGYSPLDFGYSSLEQLRLDVVHIIKKGLGIPYRGHAKPSTQLFPI